MKRISAILLIALLLICSVNTNVFAQDEQAIIDSFKIVIEKHLNTYKDDPRIMVYYVDTSKYQSISSMGPSFWTKSKVEVELDYQMDIQKTTSIITPYVGMLTYKARILNVDSQKTKEDAECANIYKLPDWYHYYKITFSYQDGKWIPKKYEYGSPRKGSIPDKWYDITNEPKDGNLERMTIKQ